MRRDKDRLSRTWGITDRHGATLKDDLEFVLAALCKGGGFCSTSVYDVLAGEEPLTAEAFAEAVLLAEGWPDPADDYQYRPEFIRLFTERYGPSISARSYRAE
jgi:hypothetical protein